MPNRRGMPEKKDRNLKLYKLYKNADNRLSTNALALMFRISQGRVWQIIRHYKKLEAQGGEILHAKT